jgi:hypothetical protein
MAEPATTTPLAASAPAVASASAPPVMPAVSDSDFHMKLLTPLDSQSSKKGDKITAEVLQPQQFQGDILQGTVRQVKSGGKSRGKSFFSFTFTTLNHAGQTIPVEARMKSVSNSQGQQNLDEEGQAVHEKNGLVRTAGGLFGTLIGEGLAVSGTGITMQARPGTTASPILIEVAAEGTNASFAPGSELILSLKNAGK